MSDLPGFPPQTILRQLRLEGLAALVAALAAYSSIGGNWVLFGVLLMVPDLAFFGYASSQRLGVRLYNFMHTYTHPVIVGGIGWFAGMPLLVEIGLIWVAHIAMDRALGYGLKYPESFKDTHLGRMGHKEAERLANAS